MKGIGSKLVSRSWRDSKIETLVKNERIKRSGREWII